MKKLLLTLYFLLLMAMHGFSQCAMCKAVPNSNMNAGGNIGSTLNVGILYLMLIPYLLLMGGVAYVFRKPIAEKWKQFKNRNHA